MKIRIRIKSILSLFLSAFFLVNCSTSEDRVISYRIEDLPLDSVPSEIWFPESFAVNTGYMTSMHNKLCLV